jgi:hypothetical protein
MQIFLRAYLLIQTRKNTKQVYMQACLHVFMIMRILLGCTHDYFHNFAKHMIGLLLGRGGGEGETRKVDFQKDEYFCGFDTVFSASFD